MKLYFAGSEVGSWRTLLSNEGVEYVSLSYMGLRRRTKFSKPWVVNERYPENQRIFLDSGAYTVNKQDADFSEDELRGIADAYMAFAYDNLERLEMVSEFDALPLGRSWIEAQREDFYDDLGDKFLPIWHMEYGLDELDRLASTYDRVGVPNGELGDRSLTPTLNNLVARYGVKLHGVAMTKKESMREVRWDSVSSTSWISPSQYGDTIVWTNQGLQRYPKKYKDQARVRHRTLFLDKGFDADKIASDDTTELLRLSIWSWSQFVDDINRRKSFDSPVTNLRVPSDSGNAEDGQSEVDNPEGKTRNSELVRNEREVRVPVPLPIIGVTQKTTTVQGADGEELTHEETQLEVRGTSMRVCDTCFLKDKCPMFKPNATCAYDIPIEVRTPDQMRQLQDALIEIQAQRVLFMKMAEDMEGGYADPNLTKEITVLSKLMETKQRSEEKGFSLTISGKERGQIGMISSIFGAEAGEALKPVEGPDVTEKMMLDSGILDAEIVDGEE